MSRLLGVALLCAALTSCTAAIPGPPPKPVPTTSPRIDKPRNLAAFDTCKALPVDGSSPNLKSTPIPPAPDPAHPGFCKYTFTYPASTVTVLVGLEEIEYDEVKKAHPSGHQGEIDGHTVWFGCDQDASELDCGVWAAVGYARSLTVKVASPGANEGWLLSHRITLIQFALDRLPVSS
ncbi:hypothetical protein ACFWNN_34375 [Lentzea sp. NPDC058450]|uniref:hypothetical protein n=1 Tax=Lentzea sp. NPDC058450 TaxID=3346505 RepID=UPI0036584D94